MTTDNVERAGAVNPHAFGTFVMPPADAGDHAKSEWGYLTGDVELSRSAEGVYEESWP